MVCLGNICRSPMADVVLSQRVDDAGLAGRVTVTSCGTGDWHVGQPMDQRAAATLRANDYDPSAHRAQQFSSSWLAGNDLVLAMDGANLAEVRRAEAEPDIQAEPDRVRLFGDFDPVEPGGEVPDPYYGGEQGFQEVLTMVERTCAVLVAALQQLADLREPPSPGAGPAT
jgi:protein-tyrosine phosphatase